MHPGPLLNIWLDSQTKNFRLAWLWIFRSNSSVREYVERFKLWLRILGLNLAIDRVVADLTDWSKDTESSYLVLDFESEFDGRCDYYRSKI